MAAAAPVAPDLSFTGGRVLQQQGFIAAGPAPQGPQHPADDVSSQHEQPVMKHSSTGSAGVGVQAQVPTSAHKPASTPTDLKVVASSPPPVSASNHPGNLPGTPLTLTTPLTLDDIWPAVLTSSHRTSSASSEDALMDLYNQFLRNGSGSFHNGKRQDSILSGGLGGPLNPSGGSLSLLQSPKVLATLQSLANTPKGFGLGFNHVTDAVQSISVAARGLDATPRGLATNGTPKGVSNTPRGLLRLESLASPGPAAGFSPGLVSLLSGPFRTVSMDKTSGISHDWLSWPPLSGMGTAVIPPPSTAGQQRHQQQQESGPLQAAGQDEQQQLQQQKQVALQPAPSVQGWLPAAPNAAAAAGGRPAEPEGVQQQQATLHNSMPMTGHAAPILLPAASEAPLHPLTLQNASHPSMYPHSSSNMLSAAATTTYHMEAPPTAEEAAHPGFRVALAPQGTPAAAAAGVAPAGPGDPESPSDEPEQHPYALMDPAAAAAASTAARQQRKKLLADLRSKKPQPVPKRRVVRRQTMPLHVQAAPALVTHQHGPLSQLDALSPEERRSLTKAARAALLARQRQQQHLIEQQQGPGAGAAAGRVGMPAELLRPGPLTLQPGQVVQRPGQMPHTHSLYAGQLAQQPVGVPAGMVLPTAAAAAAAAAESSSSDHSSTDSSDDDSSDLSSDDSDAELAAATAARAASGNVHQGPALSGHHYQQQRQHQQQQQGRGCYSTMLSAPDDVMHQQQQMTNSRRISSPGMPPLFVPVAATGRHGSGASDITAVDHHWTTAAAGGLHLGHGAISTGRRSAAGSTPNSPDQPLQLQQQVLVKDGCSRVVIDPQTSKVTVYPRTKRGRNLSQAAAGDPAAATADEQQQQLTLHDTAQRQQQQPGAAAAAAAKEELLPNGPVVIASGGTVAQQQVAGNVPKLQPEQRQQPEGLICSSSIALNRPRRQIKPTAAAAAAYMADSDDEAEADAKYDRLATASDMAVAAAAASAAAGDQASDQGSGSDLGDEGGTSEDEISSEFDDYEPSRRNGRKPRVRRQSSSAAAAAAPKRRRNSGVGSPDDHQAAAAGGRRRSRGGSSRRSPDPGSGSAAAAGPKPVIEDTRSKYRGVTRHRRSGRWEAHIWVKELGRQVYLGGYELEEAAAEAYDMAALKCKGRSCATNFPAERYADLLDSLDSMTLDELIMAVRRQSQGFSRGSSNYRGVTAHPSGRWESRIGIPGSRHVYLGLFSDEQEAARAYDGALVRLKGTAAATNYSLGCYQQQLAEHYQMKMAVEAGLVHRELFKRHSGQDFEQWIKQGLSAFDIEMTAEARDLARADIGTAAERAAVDSVPS